MFGHNSRCGGKAALLAAILVAAGSPAVAQLASAPVAKPAPALTPIQAIAPVQGAESPAIPLTPVEPPKLKLSEGTMVRLMVLKEVNSRDSKAGDRFVLRVDEGVLVDGVTVIPVGAKAWGEVVDAKGTGALGKSGSLNARLLHVESQDRQIPIQGERQADGGAATDKVIAGVIGFGVFGLFMKGNNAKLKGGEIINGYVSNDILFDAPRAKAVASQ